MITPLDVRCPYCDYLPGVPCRPSDPGSEPYFHVKRIKKAERWDAASRAVTINDRGLVVYPADYRWSGTHWSLTYWCDFCAAIHCHGGGNDQGAVDFGSRVPHCTHDDTLLNRRQVLLVPGRDVNDARPTLRTWS